MDTPHCHMFEMPTIRPGGFRDPWAFLGTNPDAQANRERKNESDGSVCAVYRAFGAQRF